LYMQIMFNTADMIDKLINCICLRLTLIEHGGY
jgi:hypothetical protein